jgi:hypothetical protein
MYAADGYPEPAARPIIQDTTMWLLAYMTLVKCRRGFYFDKPSFWVYTTHTLVAI